MRLFKEITTDVFGPHPLLEVAASMEAAVLELPCGIISEGLIKTYPIDDTINAMSRVFGLEKVNRNQLYSIYGGIKTGKSPEHNGYVARFTLNSDVIIFIVGDGTYNKEVLDKYMNKYGYFCSNKKEWNDEWVRYQYEKKFDDDVTDLVKQKGFIYHVCPANIQGKILSQGLTPHKGKYPGFSNDYRLYFFIEDKGKDGFQKIAQTFSLNKKEKNNKYIVFEIDVSKIKQEITFYKDPRVSDAIYSLQGISPDALTIKHLIET